jgi:uncharacterized protein (DUF2236 family)
MLPGMGRLVEPRDLERSLATLRSEIADPRAGLFGPGTMVWEVARESAVFLGAGRAALLQLAHPYVGTAVPEHSVTRADPVARFQGTFRMVFRMVFGDLEEAELAARRVFAIHTRVRGTIPEDAGPFRKGDPYDARDRQAQVWVLATLWDTAIHVFQRVVRPLSSEEKERYYAESRRFARLFAVEEDLPPTWAALEAWVAEMLASDTLTPTTAARAIGRHIMRPEALPARWVRRDFGFVTAQLLPPRLSHAFGIDPGGDAGAARAAKVFDAAALAVPHLPARARFLPAYLEALARIEGRTGRDRLGEVLGRLVVGQSRPPPRAR